MTSSRYQASCPQCRIEFLKLASFGSARDPVLAGFEPGVPARDSRGRYFVKAAGELKVIVYDSAGRYVTAFGNRGNGPGEFSAQIMGVFVGKGDSIKVAHQPGRLSVFAPSLKFVRDFRLPAPTAYRFQPLPNGHFVMGQLLTTPGEIGFLYHELNDSGVVVRSFGEIKGPVIAGREPSARPKTFAVAIDGKSIWASQDTIFRLEQLALDGRTIADVHLTNVPWLRGPVNIEVPTGRGRAGVVRVLDSAQIRLIGVDDLGRVWLESQVQKAGDRGPSHPQRYGLQVFDPQTKTLLMSQASDVSFIHVNGAVAYSVVTDANGVATYTAWQIVIRRP